MKRRSALKTIAALAITLAAGTVLSANGAQAADSRLTEIIERGVVRVGVLGAFKPWSFPAPDGSMQGIEVDLAQSVADALGVELETVVVTSANRMQFLQQGKIDVIIGGMYDTTDRRKVIGIIEPAYWTSGPTLLAKEGVIKDWKDIAGKPVCGKQGVHYNKAIETEYKANIVAFTGNTEGKEALRSGKCIAWVYDDASIMADLASGEWEGYEMPVSVLYNNPWAAAVSLEELDEAWGVFMSGMAYRWQASGQLIELEKKWKVKPSDWIAEQHEKHKWDMSYLEGSN
ncbi:amino acid ABC transporter substrate-binding protein (PAAT family) [Mesorhizobium sp. J18]|uniref:transporter substrate-binding domain-containing protein n=1 Tax=Mesorhizobium sp. J18 TaxID=935263 RepID=UPI0011995BFB|nr:transporter substrate-binding domain-containing protein [Mesorhizobium sp. J18]TWG94887.1 amino acid ABC transporter substrate-binding protein (PAAT family) [Mesorhizobium sp. J18]